MRTSLGLPATIVALVVTTFAWSCSSNQFTAAEQDAAVDAQSPSDAGTSDAPSIGRDGSIVFSDAAVSTTGCSDDTREYLIDESTFPTAAGCSGGWTVAGLGDGPACGRNAGSGKINGGCSAEDLCAPGWHVCSDFAEAARNGISSCPAFTAQDLDAGEFYASAQRSGGGASCDVSTDSGADDIFGCGTFGGSTSSCGGFASYLATTDPLVGEWSLGSDGSHELINVTKGPLSGGVLCCHD